MQVFLDNIVFTIQRTGGVSVYWYELLSGMCRSNLPVSFLNAHPGSANIFEQKIDYQLFPCIRESSIPSKYLRYLPLRYKLPPAAVFHGGYLRISPQKDVLNILTVHDFAHERKLASRFPRSLANTVQKAYGIKRADGIICISDSTRQELLHFYPATDPARIKVIHHGIADDFFPVDKSRMQTPVWPHPMKGPYVLYVGARSRYKNFAIAIEVMEQLPPQYQLVITGGEPWSPQELQTLNNRLHGRYHILSAVSTVQLNLLYNYAFCLLYPSVYEGFGFPPGEAMKAGCVVVTTNRTAMPEIVGTAGLLVNEATATAFTEKIRLLENENFRQQLIQAGLQQAARFTWQQSVQATIRFYQDCWHSKFSR
ncbi:glycosyltransferase family 4 protein [Chitinophaga nivalis]|uniref:Glycosyltransferase family 4 protein n=1 Tax=Chitinophaga nivalis TaxID=2991709 RepID=A0ABT3IEQ3_9BACT|nr:glycosyltransferase family 1 protein [Chitinophaga nivalis]MCW3467877.1 glycosyltransferase family 4 protein [Chitinophaga nivalis]MCW3482432.1 glycosyltransferase family 4 protein [Chitinophaga nivalis]